MLIVLAVIWSWGIVSACIATPLPADSSQKLALILNSSEFQPRKEQKGFWEALSELLWQQGGEILRYIGESLRKIFSGTGLAELKQVQWFFEQISAVLATIFDFLSSIVVGTWNVLSVLLIVGVVLCIGYLLYRIARYFTRKTPSQSGFPNESRFAATDTLAELSLEEAAAKGDYLLAILIIRYRIRLKLKEHYPIDDSMTDREVLAKLKPNDSRHRLYRAVITCFEKIVFARQPEAVGIVPEILESFRSAESSQSS